MTLLLQFHYFRGLVPPPPPPPPKNRILTTLAPFQHGYRSSVLYCIIVFKRLQTFSLRPPKTATWSLSLIFLSVCHTSVVKDFSRSYTWSRGLKIFCTFFKPRIIYATRRYLNFNSRIIYAIRGYFSSKTMLIYAFWG